MNSHPLQCGICGGICRGGHAQISASGSAIIPPLFVETPEQLRDENKSLREQLSQLQRELGAEQEAHAQLQTRCFDGGGSQSVFDRVAELQRQLALAEAHEKAEHETVLTLQRQLDGVPALIAAAKQEERRSTLNELKQRLSDNDESVMWNIENMLRDIPQKCRHCGGQMKLGKAIAQTYTGIPDFPGTDECVTLSPGGSGVLVDCIKCEKCGWSTTDGKAENGN